MAVIDRGSTALWYDRAGETGPRVLLVQGAGFPGEAWRPQIEGLAGSHQVAWYDARGVGKTPMGSAPITIAGMAEDAAAVLDALGWSDAVLVAHSMGGRVSRRLALEHPERVRGLVMITSVYRRVVPPPLTMLPIVLRYPLWRSQRRWAMLAQTFSRGWIDATGAEAAAARLEALLDMPLEDFPRRAPWHQIRAMRADRETEARIGEITTPALVIGADADRVLSPSNSPAIAAALPGAKLVMLSGCGHGLTIERADEINTLVAGFVAGLR